MEKLFTPYTKAKQLAFSTEPKKLKALIRGLRFLQAPPVGYV